MMRPARLLSVALIAGLYGCSSDDTRPRGDDLPSNGLGGSPATSGPDGGDAPSTGGGSPDAGSDVSEPAAAQLVEIAGESCVPTSAEPRLIQAADPFGLTFDQAGSSGERHFAFDSGSLAFVTFASDGSGASEPIYQDLAALVGSASGLSGLSIDDAGNLISVAFDEQGISTGASVEVAGPGTESHALAPGDVTLAVWCVDKELQGSLLEPSGSVRAEVSLGKLSCGDYGARAVALWTPPNFTVLWSRVVHEGTSALSWAVIDTGGSVLASRSLLARAEYHALASATALADGKMALLISEGFPPRGSLLMYLDAFGHPRGPSYRLLGSVEPWSVASGGASVGVTARSSDGRAVFRTISSTGEALSPWVCLDDAAPGTAFSPRAALFPKAAGFGAVVRRSDGAAAYLVLD